MTTIHIGGADDANRKGGLKDAHDLLKKMNAHKKSGDYIEVQQDIPAGKYMLGDVNLAQDGSGLTLEVVPGVVP